MTTLTWPSALVPQTAAIGSMGAGVQFKSPYNGTVQSVDFNAERWVLSCTLPPRLRAQAGEVEAFLFRLRGGVNDVSAWHFSRPVPLGTLRGAPTIKTTTARGDTSIVLANCLPMDQLLTYADFSATAWTLGTGLTVTTGQSDPIGGASAVRVAGLDGITMSPTGTVVYRTSALAVSPSTTYTFSVYVKPNSSGTIYLRLAEQDSGAVSTADTAAGTAVTAGDWRQLSLSVTTQANTASMRMVIGDNASGTLDATLWGAQLERNAAAAAYAGPATLDAGDLISAGGQLFMVASDCTADYAGDMTVPVVHRVRGTINSTTAVTWNKPTAKFVMPAWMASVVHRPGVIEGAVLELEETW